MLNTPRFPVRAIFSFLLCSVLAIAGSAQVQHGPTTVRRDLHHDVSPPLIDMMRSFRPEPYEQHEAEPRRAIPLPPGLQSLQEDPLLQPMTSGFSPQVGLNFEGIGDGQYGFTVEYAPPDTNGAVGATQYVQWVNTYFAVFDKRSGALLAGPMPGNVLWSGFGGGCESNNDGDPIVLYVGDFDPSGMFMSEVDLLALGGRFGGHDRANATAEVVAVALLEFRRLHLKAVLCVARS